MYYQVLWKFASNERDTFEKLKAYYPNSKYVSRLESIVNKREEEIRKRREELEAKTGRVTGRDGRLIAGDKGVVLDTKTGLIWAAKDNGKDITWQDAKRYCENYQGGGYSDWRMPTLDELEGLYDRSRSYQTEEGSYNVHLTELIQLTTCCPWASETRGSRAASFRFSYGGRDWSSQSNSGYGRALPVRGGN